VEARENFKLNLLIKVTNFVQISDYRLGPDCRPRLASQTADSKGSMFGFERKAARLVLLAAFSYNGMTYIATPAERCRSEEIHARCRNRIVLPAWACSLRRCRWSQSHGTISRQMGARRKEHAGRLWHPAQERDL
jgi:hypothetical protein